ncbi:MAG: DinB family protein, partial [Acidobacteriales bacterium]|nr:DinB family protein [Terriglobales bacterium]
MNTECNRISDLLASTINGEAWYGNSFREILRDVTSEQARAHPVTNAHSMWELLLHLEAWAGFAHGAVNGVPIPPWPGMPKELDWPAVRDAAERAWQQTMESFFASHLELAEIIKSFGGERLKATVPGRTYNFYRLFQSTTQHA